MKRIAFGESVQGASHKRNETECQDSMKKVEFEDGSVILAVADGHGSKACPFSKSGSGIAVNVFCTDYFEMIQQHGCEVVGANLKSWLCETSEQGSGDDITLLMCYIAKDAGKCEDKKNE